MKYILFISCLLFSPGTHAQESKEPGIFVYVDEAPKCEYDLGQYLSHNLHYPSYARKHNIEGRVVVKFVVDEDGSITGCVVEKGIGGKCDQEALRVVKKMPSWKPGKIKGKPVKVYYRLPIEFKLED